MLEYKLVIKPEFDSKFRLVRLGSSTFPKAIAIPEKSVPRKRAGIQSIARMAMPRVNKSIAPSKVPPIPNRLVNSGVREEIRPKAIRGSVVNRPSSPFERPVARRISSTSGPTPASAGRRLTAMNRIPTTNRVSVAFLCSLSPNLGSFT
jgi:hypothetical protein